MFQNIKMETWSKNTLIPAEVLIFYLFLSATFVNLPESEHEKCNFFIFKTVNPSK